MTEPTGYPLELSPEEMRRLVNLAMDRILAHLQSLPDESFAAQVHLGDDLGRRAAASVLEASLQ